MDVDHKRCFSWGENYVLVAQTVTVAAGAPWPRRRYAKPQFPCKNIMAICHINSKLTEDEGCLELMLENREDGRCFEKISGETYWILYLNLLEMDSLERKMQK